MVAAWEHHGNYIMGNHRGNTTGIACNAMGTIWEYYGKTMGILWEYHRKANAILWQYYGNAMGTLLNSLSRKCSVTRGRGRAAGVAEDHWT